ncbi:retropepsin-like aspartic protease, partial [Francisella hispaniensis]
MLRKILLICSLCLFINILQAKSLDNFLAEYDYQKLKLVNTNQEFATPYLIGKVNQNKAYVLFDSGSKGVSIFNFSVNQLKLNKIEDQNYSLNMAGQKSKNYNVILDKIEIGNISLNNIKARITTQPKKKQYPIIIVGLDFLEKYNAILDFSRSYI